MSQTSKPGAKSAGAPSVPKIKRISGVSNGPRVQGKVVIITGANSLMGIGRATAHLFAENGARAVYLCDFDSSNLDAHQREINALHPGVDVQVRQFDAADEAAVKGVVDDALRRYGRLDVFFANAGIASSLKVFTETTQEDFMEILRVNLLGVFLAAKHAAPAMKQTSPSKPSPGGSFIATASVAGLRSNAGTSAYSASKAGVVSLVQTLAYQLSGTGVRANAICPGLIETGMTAPLFDMARSKNTAGRIGQLNPMRRAGNADEVGRVVLFLGSDESSYVTGQAWAVDGGLSAGMPYVMGKLA